jgi:uncharacterized protein YutE (UPF0331/DUF86 family)
MVDEGRVARLLRAITERLDRIEATAQRRDDDAIWLDAVKYLFVTAIEACVDVAQHIAASEGFRPPSSNSDAIRILGENAVITDPTADRVARSVGFRNILVHQYREVDDQIVVGAIDELDDLRAFVAEVSSWLLAGPERD